MFKLYFFSLSSYHLTINLPAKSSFQLSILRIRLLRKLRIDTLLRSYSMFFSRFGIENGNCSSSYYRSSVADKMSDYEDIWCDPSSASIRSITPGIQLLLRRGFCFFLSKKALLLVKCKKTGVQIVKRSQIYQNFRNLNSAFVDIFLIISSV
jgi:hypothetical protein